MEVEKINYLFLEKGHKDRQINKKKLSSYFTLSIMGKMYFFFLLIFYYYFVYSLYLILFSYKFLFSISAKSSKSYDREIRYKTSNRLMCSYKRINFMEKSFHLSIQTRVKTNKNPSRILTKNQYIQTSIAK